MVALYLSYIGMFADHDAVNVSNHKARTLLVFATLRVYALMEHNIIAGLAIGALGLSAFIFICVRVTFIVPHTRISRVTKAYS